jgi:hypothetical protein
MTHIGRLPEALANLNGGVESFDLHWSIRNGSDELIVHGVPGADEDLNGKLKLLSLETVVNRLGHFTRTAFSFAAVWNSFVSGRCGKDSSSS